MMVFGHILEKMVSLLAANVIEISLWYGKLRLRLLLLLFRLFRSDGWLVARLAGEAPRRMRTTYKMELT